MQRSFTWARPLEQLTPTERLLAASWALRQVDSDIRYSIPLWSKGRTCLEFVEGKIFSGPELQELKSKYDMLPVQTPELKPAMDAIMGQLLNSGKSGKIVAVGTEDANGAFIRTVAMKSISRENQLEYREAQVARDTFTTSVPGWIWIEAFDPSNPDEPGITLVQEDWDAVIPDPNWQDRQLRDLTRATRVRRWGIEEIERFVQDDAVQARLIRNWENLGSMLPETYDGRANLIERIKNQRTEFEMTNQLAVFEMTHWVRTMILSWQDMETGDAGIIPQNWTPDEVAQFQEQNPNVKISRENKRVLWVTTVTGSGVLLANGPHWLQSGKFPGVPCVPDRLNGKWAGLVEFVLDTVKIGAYAETFWGHSIRTLSNNLWAAKKGAIGDKEEFKREVATPNGLIEVQDGFELADIKKFENSREQKAYQEWKDTTRDQLGRLLVPDNFVGGVQSSQEANAAIQTRIEQTLSRLAPLVYGWHQFRLSIRRLIVSALPYAVTSKKVYRHLDPANGMQQVTVNEPVDWDVWGNVVSTMNNLSGDEYDYMESEDDDSKTGKQAADKELLAFFEASANVPPEQREAAALASTSSTVQAYGRNLKKARENAPPPMPEVKNSVSLDANTLSANPLAQKVALNLGVLNQQDLDSLKTQIPQTGLPQMPEQPMIPPGNGLGDPVAPEGFQNG